MLANRVGITNDELVDYLIDGMSNPRLQSQARIQMFESPEKLLQAFENITDMERGFNMNLSRTSIFTPKSSAPPLKLKPKEDSSSKFRCFNCGEFGHLSTKCPKPKRLHGSCLGCGQLGHKIYDCPEKKKSPNICEPKSSDGVYIDLKLYFKNNEKCLNIAALVDTGSPISLIKEEFVPKD